MAQITSRHAVTCDLKSGFAASLRQRVIEFVRVRDFVIVNGERSCNSLQLSGSGAGDYRDLHLRPARVHGAQVLQCEAALLAAEGAGDHLDSHVARRSRPGIAGREHLALGRRLQVAVDLFVDGEAAKPFSRRRCERFDIDGERAVRMMRHGSLLLRLCALRREQRQSHKNGSEEKHRTGFQNSAARGQTIFKRPSARRFRRLETRAAAKVAPKYFLFAPQPSFTTAVESDITGRPGRRQEQSFQVAAKSGRLKAESRLERRKYGQHEEVDVGSSVSGWNSWSGRVPGECSENRIWSLCRRTSLCAALPWTGLRMDSRLLRQRLLGSGILARS